MDALKRCADTGLADSRYAAAKDALVPGDYQLLRAQDALFCLLGDSAGGARQVP
jgi:hypothetical protein